LASGGQTHKLQALLSGKPVLQHVIDAVKASGLPYHVEDVGHPGMGDSISAAVRATPDANGWLVLPGDLPLIRADTLRLLAEKLARFEVVIPVCKGQRGHPVGFSRICREQLMLLKGNQGAALVLHSHVAIEIPVDDVGTITDIDTVDDLARAQALLDAR
jgi:molybdenum cofactor cytidylyltransferase